MANSTLLLFVMAATFALASPNIAFPFNAQVPTIARINQPYTFTLSPSTFTTPPAENLTYTLLHAPAWLTLSPTTPLTLTGLPGASDAGSPTFLLVATDASSATTSMDCTLIVSADPAPEIPTSLATQLAATTNLSSPSPATVSLRPGTAFAFDFTRASFIDVLARELFYYATLADHTPLPAWLHFDAAALRFAGSAPELSVFPQSWDVLLITSDVAGFAGSSAGFTVEIGVEQLVFVPAVERWDVQVGRRVVFSALKERIFLNGGAFEGWVGANASGLPGWLGFDEKTLEIRGTVPKGFQGGLNVSVEVVDKEGNTATAIIEVEVGDGSSIFAGRVGTVVAEAGMEFRYRFADELFGEPGLALGVAIPENAQWLSFDASTKELSGLVPSSTQSSVVAATLTAKSSDGSNAQNQTFVIEIQGTVVETSTSSAVPTPTTATDASTATHSAAFAGEKTSSALSGGAIAAIVLGLLIAAVLVAGLIWLCRRRRRCSSYVDSPAPSKKSISRPIPQPSGIDTITVTTELQRDVEKNAGDPADIAAATPQLIKADEPPPQVHLALPSPQGNRKSRWLNRFSRTSQASSLGVGEEAVRADSNIPEWGQDLADMRTPHDSFSVPTEMARVSRHLSQTSQRKGGLKRLRERHRSRDSIGLGISTVASGGIARHSSRRTGGHGRGRSSFGGLSTTREASSMASISTRGTSVLSTKASEFPLPPTSTHSTSLSVPTLSVYEADPKRKSIRLVERSDSVATDNRPLDVKRESFIRNRASRGVQSPFMAHGSRASSSNTRQTGSRSTNSLRRSRCSKSGKSLLATYSESSSLEPERDKLRRSQTEDSKRFSQRIRSTFGPNYPRTISRSKVYEDDAEGAAKHDSNSAYSTTSEEITNEDWIRNEMAKPRHERTFVLPDEASPTPPPAPPTSRQQSESRNSTPQSEAQPKWRRRMSERSSSPLSSQIQLADGSSPPATREMDRGGKQRRSGPISLVSADSLNQTRPRIAHTKTRRPVSVDEVQRLSSTKAEQDTATTGGSEQWDDMDSEEEDELEAAGLVPKAADGPRASTMQSARTDLSGPAFL